MSEFVDALNPTGVCLGPKMEGCPHGAKAPPPEHTPGGAVILRYHCPACFEIYANKYGDRP